MDVLVTGGAGYIGSVCVEELLDSGFSVTVFDNLSEGHRSAVDPRASLIVGDLSDRAAVLAALKAAQAEAVVHFAASALVGESMKNPTKCFRNNVANSINLLDACAETGVRKFVFSSTCAVYGMPDRLPIDESLTQRPANPYGQSKLMIEQMLPWYRQLHGIEFATFRYFNAAGASERFGEHHRIETHLIPNILKTALGQKTSVEVFGTDYPTPDGTCIRDFIHITDLAQAHILALQPGKEGCFNLGNGTGFSVREVIHSCQRLSGQSIQVIEQPRRAGDPPHLVAVADRALGELGWKPRYTTLESMVQTALKWHRRHPDGYPNDPVDLFAAVSN